MSRFSLVSKDGLWITVGWDSALQTYFAYVEPKEGCDSGDLILWIGTNYREIRRPEALKKPLAPHRDLTPDIIRQLKNERRLSDGNGKPLIVRLLEPLISRLPIF